MSSPSSLISAYLHTPATETGDIRVVEYQENILRLLFFSTRRAIYSAALNNLRNKYQFPGLASPHNNSQANSPESLQASCCISRPDKYEIPPLLSSISRFLLLCNDRFPNQTSRDSTPAGLLDRTSRP